MRPPKAEFQRIARRDKKAFLSDQCKEIEENNRMGKTRDLFKKIRDTKGTFHAKTGTIKDRNGMDLTEASTRLEALVPSRDSRARTRSPSPRAWTEESGGLQSMGSQRVRLSD